MESKAMETGSSDAMEIWATVLADPLDGAQAYSPDLDIQQFLEGPQDEHDLDCLLGGPTNMKEAILTHEEVPLPAIRQPEKEGTWPASAVDLLDCLPKSDWRRVCGFRAPRKRRTPEQMLLHDHLVNATCLQDMPSESKGPKHGHRRNNKHWTLKEVTRLVDGVEEYGVGRWSNLKKKQFSTSARSARPTRTAENIKDKWRNLLKAYNRDAKGRFLMPLDKMLIEWIQKLAIVHPYPKSRRTYE
uniref:Uncharacterized protein n=1 Tax=Avena sativa TaxID=4498 RepID=A0ACD5YBD0_AVESA